MVQRVLGPIEIAEIANLTSGGTGNFWEAYEYISSLVENDPNVDNLTRFWLQEATKINRGDEPEGSNLFIRSITEYGLLWDGITPDPMQQISDTIGSLVVTQILSGGAIPELSEILSQDIAGALDGHSVNLGGWGGSFYFWDTIYDPDGTTPNQTVGSYILADADELEKFITVNAAAMVNQFASGVSFGDLIEIGTTGIAATAPAWLKNAIIARATGILTNTGNASGDFEFFEADGFQYRYDSATGIWTYDGAVAGNGQPVTNPTELAFLQERFDARLSHLNIVSDFDIDGSLNDQCFPAGTRITLSDGSCKPIEALTLADHVLSFDADGNAVVGKVDKLFTNTTSEFAILAFADGREDLVATPGHRFLTETGDYMEIGHMLRLGGGTARVVDVDGSVVEAAGRILAYSAETAHMFPEAQTKTIAFQGNTVLKEEVEAGWQTYNFEVREYHNYVAGDVRVHNDSILSQLQEGDQLVALNDNLTHAAVLRDVDGDGVADFVTLQGYRDPASGVFDTRLQVVRERVWDSNDGDLASELASVIGNNPDGASNVFDPESLNPNGDLNGSHGVLSTGNTWEDGSWGDDVEEAFFDDVLNYVPATDDTTPSRGAIDGLYTTVTRYVDGQPVTVPSLTGLNLVQAVTALAGVVSAINGISPGSLGYAAGAGDVSEGAPAGLSGVDAVAFLLGIDLSTEIVPAVTTNGPFGPIEISPAYTLADLATQAGVQDQSDFTIDFTGGIAAADVTRAQVGDDLVLTISNGDGTTSTLTVEGVYADGSDIEVAGVTFDGGATVALSSLSETGASDGIVSGTAGGDLIDAAFVDAQGDMITESADVVEAGDGDDTIFGGGGNDTLDLGTGTGAAWQYAQGGSGDDIYIVHSNSAAVTLGYEADNGGNDRLVFSDLNLSDFTLIDPHSGQFGQSFVMHSSSGMVLHVHGLDAANGGGHNLEAFEFADGTVINDFQFGTVADDLLTGTAGNDFLDVGAGTGTSWQNVQGGSGDDTYVVHSASAAVTLGYEADGGGTDRLVFEDLNLSDISLIAQHSAQYSGSVVMNSTTGLVIHVHGADAANGGSHNIEAFEFADGTVINSFQFGTAAADQLTGTAGADLFVFAPGQADRITGFTSGDDMVMLTGATINSFGELTNAATESGADLVFDLGNGNSLTLENTSLSDVTQDDFLFN